jgi:hypothetical protein
MDPDRLLRYILAAIVIVGFLCFAVVVVVALTT